jgi:CRP-like cAMP-binding protein
MEEIKNINKEVIRAMLKSLEFFNRFTVNEKERLLQFHTNFLVYQKNEMLICEGARDKAFFILLSGTVSVYRGKEKMEIRNLEPGDFFGDISFFTGSSRTASVKANEKVIVIKVDQNMLSEMPSNIREKMKDKVIKKLVKWLLNGNEMMAKLLY